MSEFKARIITPVHVKESEITTEMVQRCYDYMAKIVVERGEVCLPLFKRLHDELESRRANDNLMNLAKKIAEKNKGVSDDTT